MRALALVATLVGVTVVASLAQTASVRTRIYAAFVTHNEESISNPKCQPVLTDQARYLANREATLAMARLIVERGAAWNMQSEWEYQLRVADWDSASARATTSGLNILEYLSRVSPAHVQVDAHSHEKRGYNYADVAATLAVLNVADSGIVGGFTWFPTANQSWTRMREPMAAARYAYTWNARVLWGAASAGHRSDSNASGIWRPKSATDFHTHDAAQPLINVGNFPGAGEHLSADGVLDLLARLRAGTLAPGLYTATIMVEQCELDNDPTLLTSVATVLDQLADGVAQRDIVWATIGEMARVWQDEYGSAPTIYRP